MAAHPASTPHHICLQPLPCSSLSVTLCGSSAGMKLPLVLVLTWAGMSSSCPAVCRCEGVGMLQRVDCVNVGLRSVPSNLSRFTSSLRLDANFMSRLPASSFKGVPSLRYLWLDDNLLRKVPVLALSHLTELQALTLALNKISHVPDGAFTSLRQLMVLHLHDNSIQSLGRRSFDGLHNLETLDLSFNRINSFPAAVKHLRNLRKLNLQNNNISVVPENAFVGNPSIQTINIQNNPVHAVGHSSFQLLPRIHSLSDLSSNSLSLMRVTNLKQPGHLQLRVSHQYRGSELQFVFLRREKRLTSDAVETITSSTCLDSSLWLLHISVSFIFITSIILNLPLHSSQGLLTLLCWFQLLAAVCGFSIINAHCFCGSSLETDPGSGLRIVLLCLCSELMAAVVLENRTWTKSCSQISGALGCSFTLTVFLILLQEITLCSAFFLFTHSALTLLNASRLLFVTHVIRCRHREEEDAMLL